MAAVCPEEKNGSSGRKADYEAVSALLAELQRVAILTDAASQNHHAGIKKPARRAPVMSRLWYQIATGALIPGCGS